MEIRRGIAVSPGVAIGAALVFGSEEFGIPQRFVKVDAVESELVRFRAALTAVVEELSQHETLASNRLGKEYGAIFAAHRQLAADPKLIREVEELIREKHFSPEFACSRVIRRYAKQLQTLGDRYLAERAADLFDLEKRILRRLLNEKREELGQLKEPVVVLAQNLSPSETANLDTKFVLGFATEAGGKSSHTAILAGALEIPAVVGVGDFLGDVNGGCVVIIDGHAGLVIIDPDDATLARYRDAVVKFRSETVKREKYSQLDAVTLDGTAVHVFGNIEFPEEVEHCTQRGAEGIGLYRTEFLYLGYDEEPSEEVQYAAYSRVLKSVGDLPVVIRTLDLGADKIPSSLRQNIHDNPNPVLGLRSLRLCLHRPFRKLFVTQLRAILRAAKWGDLKLMFPLVSTLNELRQAKMMLNDVIEELTEEKVEFRRDIQVGMMVEVPSAALMAKEFAPEVDFFSIGTNDLIQYTLAVDRANPAVANLYSSADPSIHRMIQMVLSAAREYNTPVSVCGLMSSDPVYTPLLIGLGLRQLSVTPQALPEIKQVIRSLTVPQAEDIAQHVLNLDTASNIESYLRGELKRICPDLL